MDAKSILNQKFHLANFRFPHFQKNKYSSPSKMSQPPVELTPLDDITYPVVPSLLTSVQPQISSIQVPHVEASYEELRSKYFSAFKAKVPSLSNEQAQSLAIIMVNKIRYGVVYSQQIEDYLRRLLINE